MVLKVKPVYQRMTLSPKLGVVGISTLWHFRLPLPIQMFRKVASSPRLSAIGMPSPILWSHPLKMQRIVLLSSLLWWELGTNSLITGPGEWLSFRRFTSKLSWSWSWDVRVVSLMVNGYADICKDNTRKHLRIHTMSNRKSIITTGLKYFAYLCYRPNRHCPQWLSNRRLRLSKLRAIMVNVTTCIGIVFCVD